MKTVSAVTLSLMALSSMTAAAAPTLAGSEWGPENGLGQYVQFKSDGEVFGFAGCNTFIGTYAQKGDKIKVSNISATKKLCEDMQGAELAFLQGLENANSLKMVKTDLRMYNANGKWVLGMRQRKS